MSKCLINVRCLSVNCDPTFGPLGMHGQTCISWSNGSLKFRHMYKMCKQESVIQCYAGKSVVIYVWSNLE